MQADRETVRSEGASLGRVTGTTAQRGKTLDSGGSCTAAKTCAESPCAGHKD